jgi:hypothetical protein
LSQFDTDAQTPAQRIRQKTIFPLSRELDIAVAITKIWKACGLPLAGLVLPTLLQLKILENYKKQHVSDERKYSIYKYLGCGVGSCN